MPTYEYRRPDGSTFEVFQKISDDALTHDPETGVPVQRVISGGAGLQFKGDGFYLTDYVRKNGGKDKGSDESKADAPASSKNEKPAGKSASPTTSTPAKAKDD